MCSAAVSMSVMGAGCCRLCARLCVCQDRHGAGESAVWQRLLAVVAAGEVWVAAAAALAAFNEMCCALTTAAVHSVFARYGASAAVSER
jgi:hypothetical protein